MRVLPGHLMWGTTEVAWRMQCRSMASVFANGGWWWAVPVPPGAKGRLRWSASP